MQHETPLLLATLVVTLTLALAFGALTRALRLPTLVGYLLAGVAVGPYTPGFIADSGFTAQMAEVGVALLLFGVGMHFRPRDLLDVWHLAVPGALAQIVVALALGALAGHAALGLEAGPSMVFGLALAISSTAVATRALEGRGRLNGQAGRVALGWLVMQDLVVVFALVLLPVLAGDNGGNLLRKLGASALELAGFVALMMLVGRRALPWALARLAGTGSRELFTLAVIVAALGVAFMATTLFGVSFAIGAFFAGVVLGESDIGHQAAAEAVPLQRVFTALFFASIGMLLDPMLVAEHPEAALAALLVVPVGIGLSALALLLLLRVPPSTACLVAASLAQIGEFSFVLLELAEAQELLPDSARGPVLAAAFGSILLAPLAFRLGEWAVPRLEAWPSLTRWQRLDRPMNAPEPHWPRLRNHAILVGHGRVGSLVSAALRRHGLSCVVIEEERRVAEALRRKGQAVVWGDATRPEVMEAASPGSALLLVVALPGAWQAREVIRLARLANPAIEVAVRTHTDDEVAWLTGDAQVGFAVMGEREVALGIADFCMQRLGVDAAEAQATVDELRAGMARAGGGVTASAVAAS
jgi:CPA2 family monovalent cation:H+ antiporter-2